MRNARLEFADMPTRSHNSVINGKPKETIHRRVARNDKGKKKQDQDMPTRSQVLYAEVGVTRVRAGLPVVSR
jgi:hypothetical protein